MVWGCKMSQFDRNWKPDPDTGKDNPLVLTLAAVLLAFLVLVMAFL